jgi:hypothetical protein
VKVPNYYADLTSAVIVNSFACQHKEGMGLLHKGWASKLA